MRTTRFHIPWTLGVLGAVCGFGAPPAALSAQILSGGIHADWGSESDIGVGARAAIGMSWLLRGLEAVGSYRYSFPGESAGADMARWELSTDLVYRIDVGRRLLTPYLGAGVTMVKEEASVGVLGITASGDDTLGGVVLVGGLLLGDRRARPFVEARMLTGDAAQFVALAGIRFEVW